MTRIALLQMTAGIDPEENAAVVAEAVTEAALGGAKILFTPEMTGLLDRDRTRAAQHIVPETDNPVLAAARTTADIHGIWVAIGSLALKGDGEKWVNRSLLIDDSGRIVARYDKIHMFDVDLATGESWRESNAYTPGKKVVAADSPVGKLGLSICYDLRFPALFEALGRKLCDAIAVPAAFTAPTGKAHWHILQRARAIEASAYVIAAAQVGKHADGRETYGHSLVVDPWGDIVLDMGGSDTGIAFAEIDPARIAEVRSQLPSLANRREISI